MPKVIPVPGVPPHEWHKHPPNSDNIEIKSRTTASTAKSVTTEQDTRNEINNRQESETQQRLAPEVSLKQWSTTANDPGRFRRLMPGGYVPLRAVPISKLDSSYTGRMLYPHEATRMLSMQDVGVEYPQATTRETQSSARQYSDNSRAMQHEEPGPHENASRPTETVSQESDQVTTMQESSTPLVGGPALGEKTTRDSFEADDTPLTFTQDNLTQSDKSREVKVAPQADSGATKEERTSACTVSERTQLRRKYGTKPQVRAMDRQLSNTREKDFSDRDSDGVAPSPRSPNLRQIQIPRPNRNYEASVRSNVSVLSLKEDDNARGIVHYDSLSSKHGDIRSKLGLEPHLHMSEKGELINTDTWAEIPRTMEAYFKDDMYTHPWISDFCQNQSDFDVRATFLYEKDSVIHCHSDVDTFSGQLLKPIQYSYTVPDYMDSDNIDRQMNCSSSLYVHKKTGNMTHSRNNSAGAGNNRISPRHNSVGTRKNQFCPMSSGKGDTGIQGGSCPPARGWVDGPGGLNGRTLAQAPQQGPAQLIMQPTGRTTFKDETDKKEENPYAPRVECHLRPARKEDMEGVREIYNWEIANGIQAPDTEPLSLADWYDILKKIQDAKLPFVVAIRGLHPTQGKAHLDGPPKTADDEVIGKVLAFGFLTVRQPGFAGGFEGSSRLSTKAHVFVHPGWRRKKLFHICLDKLLSTVSCRYATKEGYKFVNPGDDPVYKYPWHHDRKTWSVIVEYLVPRGLCSPYKPDEKDLVWFERLMGNKYKFWKVGCLEAAYRTRRSSERQSVWLDAVILEHICQAGLDAL